MFSASFVPSLLPLPPADNGLNPSWPRKSFHFTVCNSAFAFLRFVVYEIDMFSDQNFLAQATFPIHSLKTGERVEGRVRVSYDDADRCVRACVCV